MLVLEIFVLSTCLCEPFTFIVDRGSESVKCSYIYIEIIGMLCVEQTFQCFVHDIQCMH